MIFIKANFKKILFLAYTLFTPISVLLAQQPAGSGNCDPSGGRICNPISTAENLQEFLKNVLEGVLKIGIPIVALAVIYCGFLFVQARGKPEELTKAKDALLYTLIGAGILLGAWALAILVSDTVLELGTP